MNAIGPNTVLTAFVLFCRIGACLMMMPGFSSQRVPVNVRLFLTVSVTLALTPLLASSVEAVLPEAPMSLLRVIASELAIGGLIGFMGRIFFAALETMTNTIAMSVGLANPLAAPMESDEALPVIATLITFTATTLIFVTDQHWEILRGVVESYKAMPAAASFGPQFGLIQIADCLSKAFFLSLRIASPFMIYSILVNLAMGIVNKLTPVVPVYFVLTPFVLGGAVLLLYFTSRQMLDLFMSGFGAWLASG